MRVLTADGRNRTAGPSPAVLRLGFGGEASKRSLASAGLPDASSVVVHAALFHALALRGAMAIRDVSAYALSVGQVLSRDIDA